MNEESIEKKITDSEFIPDNIKKIVTEKRGKISVSSLTKERVISLYELRKTGLIADKLYKSVVAEIERMITILKGHKDGIVLMINIISSECYVIIFSDEAVDQIIGVLDLTGMGNTSSYLSSVD